MSKLKELALQVTNKTDWWIFRNYRAVTKT